MTELNIDTFGAIMDEMLKKNAWAVLIKSEPDTDEVTVDGFGSVVLDFYGLIAGLARTAHELVKQMPMKDNGIMLDKILALVKTEVMEELKEADDRPDDADGEQLPQSAAQTVSSADSGRVGSEPHCGSFTADPFADANPPKGGADSEKAFGRGDGK